MASTGGKFDPLLLSSIPDKCSRSAMSQISKISYRLSLQYTVLNLIPSVTRASMREKKKTCSLA